MDRASKKRRNKTAFGTRGQTETSLKIEDLLSNKTTGNFHKSLREFYIIIFLNKLKMVENTHQKYEKNQNKTSVAKRFTGPFLALRAPDRCSYWNPSRRHWLWRGQLFMRCFVIPQTLRSWAIYDTKSLLFRNPKTYFVSRLNRSFRKWWIKKTPICLIIQSKTIIWQKQHFLGKNSTSYEKSGLFQLFINLLDIVKSKSDLASSRCVPFFSTEVVLISPTVSLLWIPLGNIERPNNLDSVIDDRGIATVMIIRMNKIGREVRGRPVGTRENPGGASKGVKLPEAPWFLGISTSLEACKCSVFHPLIVRFSAK